MLGYIDNVLVEIIQNDIVIKSGFTDANGRYTTPLEIGTYKIRLSKTGFKTIEKIETLNQPMELMVNLPLEHYFVKGVSHVDVQVFLSEYIVDNPTVETIHSESVVDNLKTVTTTSLHSESVA